MDDTASDEMAGSLARIPDPKWEWPGAPMRTLTGFSWDGVYLFESFSHGSDVRKATGFTFMPDEEVLLEGQTLIVFVRAEKLVKALLLGGHPEPPLHFDSGRKYSTNVRLLNGGGRAIHVADPSVFQKAYDPALEDLIAHRIEEAGTKGAVAIGELGFRWDEMRIIDTPAMNKEAAGAGYPPWNKFAFMVFESDGRVVRVVELRGLDFKWEVLEDLYGRTWGPDTRIIKNPDGWGVTLRDG